jgi:hypothetical protein
MDELRPTLAKFNYFLACPGVTMPYAHNIIEAMSVGCIPIIQKEYATMFFPALENEINAIIFSGLSELVSRIKFALNLPESQIGFMRREVTKYYNNQLTPLALRHKLLKYPYSKIYLQAEHNSVALIKNS